MKIWSMRKKKSRSLKWLASALILICFFIAIQAAQVQAADSKLLWLVNPAHSIEPGFYPENLIHVNGYLMRREAGEALVKMQKDMQATGITSLRLQSAYRPYSYQQAIFADKARALMGLGYAEEEARALAARSVALPGTSEHQTGLAVDVSIDGRLNARFGATEAGVWLHNNCTKYGFIIRYPKEKTIETKIIYEPWHLRYVGVPHAGYMQELEMCLEEYIEYVKEAGALLYWMNQGSYYKVSFSEGPPGDGVEYSSIGPGDGYIVTELRKFYR